ncbi:MAG: metallophosphoesterase family protein [Candidatus Hodarchaeota archaeon]
MLRTVILRFSDYEKVDTILAHQEIIKARKCVWWGWWKKKHETMQGEALKEIGKRCPIEIGLLNRTVQKFYSARCTNVVFDSKGGRRPSPDLECTPSYYRDSQHPAWFEFSSIEPLSGDLFKREFGAVPEGDPTLFIVEETEFGTSVLPRFSMPELDVIKAKGDSILHLSDLHFGDDHAFAVVKSDDPIEKLPMTSKISRHIKSLPDCVIGVIVISGDITTKGRADGYPVASILLDSLLKDLGLEKEHMIIVPGNHDIWLHDTDHPTYDYQPEEPFRLFIRGFYGKDILELERLSTFRTPGGWKLSFVGLNSARPRKTETKDYGYVGFDRYDPWLRTIANSNEGKSLTELVHEKRLNFAVLHHHLLPAKLVCEPERPRPVSLTLDAGQLVADFQASGVHFTLHGHQHVPFVGSTARARLVHNTYSGLEQRLFVIGSGSSGAKRLWDEMRNNTFGIYTPQKNGLHIRMQEFNPSLRPSTFMDLVIPF